MIFESTLKPTEKVHQQKIPDTMIEPDIQNFNTTVAFLELPGLVQKNESCWSSSTQPTSNTMLSDHIHI